MYWSVLWSLIIYHLLTLTHLTFPLNQQVIVILNLVYTYAGIVIDMCEQLEISWWKAYKSPFVWNPDDHSQ